MSIVIPGPLTFKYEDDVHYCSTFTAYILSLKAQVDFKRQN